MTPYNNNNNNNYYYTYLMASFPGQPENLGKLVPESCLLIFVNT